MEEISGEDFEEFHVDFGIDESAGVVIVVVEKRFCKRGCCWFGKKEIQSVRVCSTQNCIERSLLAWRLVVVDVVGESSVSDQTSWFGTFIFREVEHA